MARQPRYILPDQVQHVIQRGNNKAAIFLRDEDYDFYLKCLDEACAAHECDVHAYVLMPNHVHLLLTPRRDNSISKVMQSVGGRYAQYVNAAYRRTGTVWGGRYRSTVIDADDYLFTCMRYIELNPVRAGIVTTPAQYPWSSYRGNAEGSMDRLLTAHPAYIRLGDVASSRQEKYRAQFGARLESSVLASIRDATNKGWVLGNGQFRDRLGATLSRRVQPLPRGGDRRSAHARRCAEPIESDPTAPTGKIDAAADNERHRAAPATGTRDDETIV